MKELKLAVIVFLFLTCFLLTVFAFANWEINPGNWTYGARAGFSIVQMGANTKLTGAGTVHVLASVVPHFLKK